MIWGGQRGVAVLELLSAGWCGGGWMGLRSGICTGRSRYSTPNWETLLFISLSLCMWCCKTVMNLIAVKGSSHCSSSTTLYSCYYEFGHGTFSGHPHNAHLHIGLLDGALCNIAELFSTTHSTAQVHQWRFHGSMLDLMHLLAVVLAEAAKLTPGEA